MSLCPHALCGGGGVGVEMRRGGSSVGELWAWEIPPELGGWQGQASSPTLIHPQLQSLAAGATPREGGGGRPDTSPVLI